MKKYKVEIPEGYEVENQITGEYVPKNRISTTIVFKPIKDKLPNTWDEYCEITGHGIMRTDYIHARHYTEEFTALYKLLLLRDCYNDGWVPDYEDDENKYGLRIHKNTVRNKVLRETNTTLIFKEEALRNKFFENFTQLIKIAKPLL